MKCKTLGVYCVLLCTVPMRVRGNWPHLARIAVKWCSQFWLQHGLAASVSIVLGKAECCRQSWAFAERKLTTVKSEYWFAA